MAQAALTMCVSRNVLLKSRVNWTAVCDAIRELPWRSIWRAENSVDLMNVYLSLLVERFVLTKVIRVSNKHKPWCNDDSKRVFEIKQEAHLRWIRNRSELTGMSCFTSRGGLMYYMSRLGVTLVSESGGSGDRPVSSQVVVHR